MGELFRYLIKIELAIFECTHIVFEDSFYKDLEFKIQNQNLNPKRTILDIKDFIAKHKNQDNYHIKVKSIEDVNTSMPSKEIKPTNGKPKMNESFRLFIMDLEAACGYIMDNEKTFSDTIYTQKNLHLVMREQFDYSNGLQAMNQRVKRNFKYLQFYVEENLIEIPNLRKYITPFNEI